MLSELSYALKLGYILYHIHECHVYKEADFILRDFTAILTSMKTRFYNLWVDRSEKEKGEYCNYLNNKCLLYF